MSDYVEDLPMDGYEGPEPMRLRHSIGLYLAALVIMTVAFFAWFYLPWFSGLLLVGCYFACGLWLNRTILARLIVWHPMHDTISAVSVTKLRFFFFWPVNFGLLLTQLVIQRVL